MRARDLIDGIASRRRLAAIVLTSVVVMGALGAAAAIPAPPRAGTTATDGTRQVSGPAGLGEEAKTASDGTKADRKARRARPTPPRTDAGSLMRSFGALVVVLGLIFAGAILAGRLLRRARLRPAGDKVLELIDVLPLGTKGQVYVVQAYDRRLVIGCAGEAMNVLAEFDDEELAETPPEFDGRLEKRLAHMEASA